MRANTVILLLTIVASSLLVFGGIIYAAPFTNGSFEFASVTPVNDFIYIVSPSTAITGWQVVTGSIDYVDGTMWQHADGVRSLDMNGSNPGGIAQTFDTITGHQYRVTFWLAANLGGGPTIKTLEVAATGNSAQDYTFDITGHSNVSMGWTQNTYDFLASGSSVRYRLRVSRPIHLDPAGMVLLWTTFP